MTNPPDILIINNTEGICHTLSSILTKEGYRLNITPTFEAALDLVQQKFFNIALIDIQVPDLADIALVAQLKELHPHMEILLITGYATLEKAMEATQANAYHYFIKPLNMDDVLAKIKEVLDRQGLVLENKRLYETTLRELSERKRAEEEIRQRNRELALLNRVIAASATSLDAESILETTCRELAMAFDIPQAIAFLPNEQKTEIVVVAEYINGDYPSLINHTISVDNSITKELARKKAPIIINRPQTDPRLTHTYNILANMDVATLLIVPLIINEDVVGSLNLGGTKAHIFSDAEINLIGHVAEQVSGTLARTWLDKERRRLSTVMEQSVESVIITDTQGTIIYVNPSFERITGYSRAEVTGKNPNILNSGQQDTAFYQDLWSTITKGQVWQGRLVNKKKDGTFYTEESLISPVRNENGSIVNYVSLQRDVTRELQLEEQYWRSQRMDAVGQLTGGIAHDFNNLLTAINGFAELLKFRLPPNDPLQDLAGNILNAGQRAANLVRQLLAFSRKQIIEPKVLDLNTIVTNMGTILHRVIGEHIEIGVQLSPDIWPVKVDPAQIEQVIINLAINAQDAMPDGGKLTIETANVVLDEDYVAQHLGSQPGAHVFLKISDTGIGMSKDVQARIFEPFFTTKDVGKGTGLGLSMVFGIIKQSNGNIWVSSEEGKGTTFEIYLPRVQESVPNLSPLNKQQALPTGHETILLVEDDENVRKLTQEILQKQGYTLLQAANGKEALQTAESYHDPIHLLLTDVVMPGMSGKKLAEQITQQRPTVKVIYMSGYTEDIVAHHGMLENGVTLLHKPFSTTILTRQIRTILDG